MRIAISGTYSCGKTLTSMVLARHNGVPRSRARTIREIMPTALPGRALREVTPAEYVQLQVRRHTERAVHEALLGDRFVADGTSLQEWAYAQARLRYGMDPAAGKPAGEAPGMDFFGEVTAQLRSVVGDHVRSAFDAVVHLPNEFPISADGHRPMHERFRADCDALLRGELERLGIPHVVIGGDLATRVRGIVAAFGLDVARPLPEAVALAERDYALIDWRLEQQRSATGARS